MSYILWATYNVDFMCVEVFYLSERVRETFPDFVFGFNLKKF